MKIKGNIGGAKVVVLIDSGATHNFISKHVVAQLGLAMSNTSMVRVRLSNGMTDKSSGTCKGVLLTLPEYQVMDEFLPLPLGGTNVILGIKWLRT